MSEFLSRAAEELNQKLADGSFSGSAKFVISGEGAVVLDASGARIADEETDVTLTADMDTFRAIFEGEMNPTSAFMSGKLSVDGDMGMAMQLASVLA